MLCVLMVVDGMRSAVCLGMFGGGGVGGASVAVCVIDDSCSQVGHSTGGPPCWAQSVEEIDALLQFFCCSVDVLKVGVRSQLMLSHVVSRYVKH
jgi:hypothetical protein